MIARIICGIIGAILLCGANVASGAETNSQRQTKTFRVAAVAEQRVPNTPSVFIISTPSHRFALSVPLGWSLFSDEAAWTVTLRRAPSQITIRFHNTDFTTKPGKWLEELRERYSGAEVVDTPGLMAFSHKVDGFDLLWQHSTGSIQAGRFGRISLDEIQVEFSLVTASESFKAQLSTLMQIMATMRVAAGDGVPQIPSFGVE